MLLTVEKACASFRYLLLATNGSQSRRWRGGPAAEMAPASRRSRARRPEITTVPCRWLGRAGSAHGKKMKG